MNQADNTGNTSNILRRIFTFSLGDLLGMGMAACGLWLMARSSKISKLLPWEFKAEIAFASIALLIGTLILLTVWMIWKQGISRRTTLRYVIVIGFFFFFLFPPGAGAFRSPYVHMLTIAGAALLVSGLAQFQKIHGLFGRLAPLYDYALRVNGRWVATGLFTAFLATTVYLCWSIFHLRPVYDDSLAQYIHSKILASGKLFETHPLQGMFAVKLMVNTREQWFSIWQPLHAMIQAIGHYFGTPWLVNPTLGALSVVGTYLLARRCVGERTARLAGALMLLSPMVIFMSSEYMNHATSLLFSVLFMLCYVEMLEALKDGRRKHTLWFAVGAGLSLGCIFLIRPLTCIGIGIAFGFHFFYLFARNWRAYLDCFLGMGAGIIATMAVQAWYNYQITGNALLMPYIHHHWRGVPGFSGHHNPLRGLLKAQDEWQYMNHVMYEWFMPATFFMMLYCLLPMANRYMRLLMAMLFGFTIVNMINHFAYHIFGPRFIYETSPAIAIFTAAGIQRLPLLLRIWKQPLPVGRGVRKSILLLLLAAIFTTGWSHKMPSVVRMYENYFHNKPKFVASMERQAKAPALIFIERIQRKPRDKAGDLPGKGTKNKPPDKYLWVAFTNPPRKDAPIIFARDRGDARNKRLMEYYPKRNAYLEYKGRLYRIHPKTMRSKARLLQERDRKKALEKYKDFVDVPAENPKDAPKPETAPKEP